MDCPLRKWVFEMKNLSNILFSFFKGKMDFADKMKHCIFYKIVDCFTRNNMELYKLQCINTAGIFDASVHEIVADVDILYGLHPLQASYIGLEYAKHFKKDKNTFNHYVDNRYGIYQIYAISRENKITFIDINKKKKYTMDPRDIVLTDEVIKQFDATQAFYIGFLAGLALENCRAIEKKISSTAPLRLVK